MKVLRYIAGILLLGSGSSHVLLGSWSPDNPEALTIMVFGIFYISTGFLMLFNFRFAPLLGMIFPLIGLAAGIFVIGIHHWTLVLTILFIIDTVVVFLSYLCRKKSNSTISKKILMKKSLIFLFICLWMHTGQAQEEEQKSLPVSKRFHIGLSYGYNQTDMKLLYMEELFTWNEQSSEPRELTSEEIDNMNAREKFTRRFQALTLEAGFVILDKPESKWFIDGTLRMGIAASKYQVQDNQIDTLAMEYKSGFKIPTVSLQFNFTYKMTPHWGIAAVPIFTYAYGVDKEIKDNTYGQIQNFEETRKCDYNYLYGRLNLLAVWMNRSLKIGVGPGFYVLYNTNDYHINRTNPANGDFYSTQVITHLISKSFIDGNIHIEWKIIPSLAVTGFIGVGGDITARGSLAYYF